MLNKIFDLRFLRCPKSGRVVGIRRDMGLTRALFPVLGLASIAWFLIRVIPKPSRALYPCQKVAAGLGAGFLAQAAGLLAACAGYRVLRRNCGQVAIIVVVALATASYARLALSQGAAEEKIVQVLTPAEGANHPMGRAKGINPGRVVWTQDFDATLWDGQTGNWWDEKNVSQAEVEKMFSQSLQALTGERSDRQAWDRLFRYYNRSAGRGDRGYQKGEQVLVKLNCNADEGKQPWGNNGYPTPHVVYTLVRQLTETAGVPAARITLSDPSRYIGVPIYEKVRSHPAFREITFEGQDGDPAPQRVRPAPDLNAPIYFSMPGGKKGVMYPPQSHVGATYLISYALVRPHRVFGVTLSAKNFYGSVFDTELKIFKPAMLHAFALWDYATPNKMGDSHSLPALLGHQHLGGKTILFFADGLYTSYNQTKPVVKWSTMKDRWFSGMLMSQDPVALDSVGYDLIRSEPNLTTGNPSFNGHVDNYLHEAAQADHPPSGTKYDPENKGAVLESLGVHEHWNSAAEMKYSRNLGRKEGIDLVTIR